MAIYRGDANSYVPCIAVRLRKQRSRGSVSLLAGKVHSRRRLINSRRDGQRRNLHDIAIER
jgi:hypothetical protein